MDKPKITIFSPWGEFGAQEKRVLTGFGHVSYTTDHRELSASALSKMARGAQVLMVEPENLGGFEKAKPRLTEVMEADPVLKSLALGTTSYGWVDLDYCRRRGITVSNVPGFNRESVAEHTIALFLCLAKRIIVTDRAAQRGEYKLEMGFELFGKTLGVIGLGAIGSRVAELGQGIGMMVIAYNRSPKRQKGVEIVSLASLLRRSDAISINLRDCSETVNFLGVERMAMMKKGVIIVNTADRSLVDEVAMAKYIKNGRVYGYAFEGEDLDHGPLAGLENAVGIYGFGWYTKEGLERLRKIWIDNVRAALEGRPRNVVG